MSQPILWEHFQPGARLGEITQTYTASLSDSWSLIFGAQPPR